MKIRKIVTVVEEILEEGGKEVSPPTRTAVAMAVIENPLAGRYVEDLSAFIDEHSPALGKLLGKRAVEALGEEAEAYGKGALVGLDGEIEHGSAIIHTLKFGNEFRGLVGGKSLLPSAEKRGAAGASLDLAIKHKIDAATRTHHQTFEVRIPDAPRPNEIVVMAVVTNAGRPHPRIGDLKAEMARMGG